MWVHVLFMAASLGLLGYWFRYTCLLILSVRSARDYAAGVARANALQFPEVQQKLAEERPGEAAYLDVLRRALDRDYILLTCLLRHGPEFRNVGQLIEHRMSKLDVQIMRALDT